MGFRFISSGSNHGNSDTLFNLFCDLWKEGHGRGLTKAKMAKMAKPWVTSLHPSVTPDKELVYKPKPLTLRGVGRAVGPSYLCEDSGSGRRVICRKYVVNLIWGEGFLWLKNHERDSPGSPVVKSPPCNVQDEGSALGWGTEILHDTEQLSPCAMTTEPAVLLPKWRSACRNEDSTQPNKELMKKIITYLRQTEV